MDRAVPLTWFMTPSRSKLFRSGILILAISSTCFRVILPTRGLQVLGVAFNPEAQGNPGAVARFVSQNQVNFPMGTMSRAGVLRYLGLSVMDRLATPQVVIMDRKGTIRAQSEPLGSAELQMEESLRPLLEGLLK
jgi:hypothetical protein